MLRLFAALLAAAFAMLAPAASARASVGDAGQSERIISYFGDIEVAADASLHVTETIRVEAEGRDIRHGIYREFPTRYERGGRVVEAGLSVDGVECDGHSEPWRQEAIDGGVRIWIGNAERELTPGEHSYVIRYTTTRQLNLSNPDFDELYWNVTGNGWPFQIDAAGARVHLPQAVRFGQRAFYTGSRGSTAHDAEIVSEGPGEIVIRTTRPLAGGEGLTIAVSWPRDIVRRSEGEAR